MRLLPRSASGYAVVESLISVLLLTTAASAQQSVGVVSGRVIIRDSASTAVSNVEVYTRTPRVWTRTDTSGAFNLGGLSAGKTELYFRRLGFEPKTEKVDLSSGQPLRLEVVMTPVPAELAALVVQESQLRARELMRDFYNRRDEGLGHFITRQEIEQRNPSYMSDMMRMVPGARLVPQQVGGAATLRFARNSIAGRDCPPQYYIDGVMARGFNIDDIPPMDVEGIEIYSGVSQIPAQFKNMFSTAMCGVVVIWSRLPGT
jgi:hypothetical protein